jgi:hypothetical protein
MTFAQACLKKLWENALAIFGPAVLALLALFSTGKIPAREVIIGVICTALFGSLSLMLKQGSSVKSVQTPAISKPLQ